MRFLVSVLASAALMGGVLLSQGDTPARAVCSDSFCPATPFVTSSPFPVGGTTSAGTQPPASTATVPSGCGSRC